MNLCHGLLGTAGTALMDGMGKLRLSVGTHILPVVFSVICIKSMLTFKSSDLTSVAGGNMY